MPLPLPDVVQESERVMAQVLQLLAVQRQLARMKQMDSQLDERDEEQQVQRSHDMRPNQGCQLA